MTDLDGLREQIASIDSWYHVIDFGAGLVTPGAFDMRKYLSHYPLPDTLDGLRVLDVGASNGYFAAEFVRRGASEVVALDLPGWEHHDWSPRQRAVLEARTASERKHVDEVLFSRALGLVARELGEGRVIVESRAIYDISPEALGYFDLVFCGSMLMHVRDPLLGLHAIRSVLRESGTLVISVSTIAEDDPRPLAAFVGEWDQSNFWQMNPACLRRMLVTADFVPEGDGVLYDQRAETADFVDRIFLTKAVPLTRAAEPPPGGAVSARRRDPRAGKGAPR